MLRSTFLALIVPAFILTGCANAPVAGGNQPAPRAEASAPPLVAPAPRVIAVPPAVADGSQVSARPIAGPVLRYPPDMMKVAQEGAVDVACTVQTDGTTRDCVVLDYTGGAAFADAALDYVSHARFRPAMHDGVPVEEKRHRWTIAFKLNSPPAPLPQTWMISSDPISGPALVYPAKVKQQHKLWRVQVECTVMVTGWTKDCVVRMSADDAEFNKAALDYVSRSRYVPQIVQGIASEARHMWTIRFSEEDMRRPRDVYRGVLPPQVMSPPQASPPP